jgi:hypothetical protein
MGTTSSISLREKLFNAKAEIGKISKDSTNPFFKSKYFDVNSLLEHVEPILQKNRLLLLQPINSGFVTTVIMDIDSDDAVDCGIALPPLNDPQKLGSAITYYRRYTLQSLLGLQAEDDDGNRAAKPAPPKSYKRHEEKLKACASLAELQKVYTSFTTAEKTATLKLKDELKLKLK